MPNFEFCDDSGPQTCGFNWCDEVFKMGRSNYQRFCGLEPQVRNNRDKLNNIEAKFTENIGTVEGLAKSNQENLNVLDGRIESLDKKFELLKTLFEFMEKKLDDNSKAIKDLTYSVEKIWDMLNRK
jgi:hypothetical protein